MSHALNASAWSAMVGAIPSDLAVAKARREAVQHECNTVGWLLDQLDTLSHDEIRSYLQSSLERGFDRLDEEEAP